MSSLIDTPSAPEPKGARVVRPLDAPAKADIPVNNKSASIRTLLSQHPDGLGYDDISRYTGVARDRVGAFVAALISSGDVKPYEFPERGRVFKYVGDPKRAGSRVEHPPKERPPLPIAKEAARPPAQTELATPSATPRTAPLEEGAEPARVAGPVAAMSPAPAVAEQKQPLAEPQAQPPSVGEPQTEHLSQPGKKVSAAKSPLYDLSTELAIIAAANLAAAVRDCNIDGIPELERALLNFERADRAREESKVGAT